ncbi:MAG: ribose 5-phosphate isomerase B [Deltaproteobacteria bacterium]|nr:ribose 5-phosphate isomerase B [Deltaproteobacteria bacterium]
MTQSSPSTTIVIGADHAGFPLKQELARYMASLGYQIMDVGTHSDASVDYPDLAALVARHVQDGSAARGVLVCGSAIGMAMAANRHAGVRAAVLRDRFDAQMSREHNDANVACFGGRVTHASVANELLALWLATPFAGGRHERRVRKLDRR